MNAAPPPVDAWSRWKSRSVVAALGLSLLFGALVVRFYPGLADPATAQATADALRHGPLYYGYSLAMLVVLFLWLTADARQLDIRRPWWLNLGIVLLPPLFVPYYLYKTRPQGQRGPAIFAFFATIAGCLFAAFVGSFVALMVFGHAPTTPAPRF